MDVHDINKSYYFTICFNNDFSVTSSNTNTNLFSVKISHGANFFIEVELSGGGHNGSSPILKYKFIYLNALSNIIGINRPSNADDASRHGLVFASIKYILKELSIMKSNPNI